MVRPSGLSNFFSAFMLGRPAYGGTPLLFILPQPLEIPLFIGYILYSGLFRNKTSIFTIIPGFLQGLKFVRGEDKMKNRFLIVLLGVVVSLSFAANVLALTSGEATSGEFTLVPTGYANITLGLQNVDFGGAAWADYDNDGYLDMLLCGSNSNYQRVTRLYRNSPAPNNTRVFTDINAGLIGLCGSVAWGDYNNDGYLDILLCGDANSENITKIYRNDPGPNNTRIFTDINAGLPGLSDGSVAWGDYDNDGNLDILLCGASYNGVLLNKIYHNNGNGTFTDINAGLIGLCGSVAWGDYNNDGYLDIACAGQPINGSSETAARIYRNDPGPNNTRVFTDINAGLQGVYSGCSLAWGDYDNDGYLDLLVAGDANSSYLGHLTRIYRNNGNGTFTNINAGLIGIDFASVAWGDYNNDGYLDIALSGSTDSGLIITRIYRNNGNGTFTNINAGLQGVLFSSIAWGDYENDGDLDLLVTGTTTANEYTPFTGLYRNNLGTNIPVVNTAPYPPNAITSVVNASGNVTLSWVKATDNQTPQNGLYYNLYIGTTQYGVDKLSPMAEVPGGFRRIAAMGSQNENISVPINGLPYGTYYWGVQSVDTGFMGSPFALGTFTLQGSWTNVGNPGFSTGLATYTSLALNSSNVPYVGYVDSYYSGGKPVVKKFDGTSWVNVGAPGFTAEPVYQSSLAIGSNNIPYVAYDIMAAGANNGKITVKKFDGTNWVNVGNPAFGIGGAEVSIALNSSNIPYVAYRDFANGQKATVKKLNGSSWVNVGIPGFSAGVSAYISLAIGSNNIPYVAYRDGGNNNKATVKKFDGTSWVNVGTPGFSVFGAEYISIVLNSNNVPYISYAAYADGYKATVKKFDGTNWVNVGSPAFSAGSAYYTSLAFDSSNVPYVAYRDGSNSSKATVKKFDGTNWVNVGNPAFSAGAANYTSLALDSSNVPYVAYEDGANGNKATVMKYQ